MSCADWECFCAICGGPLRSVRYAIGDEDNPRCGLDDTYDCDVFLTRPDYPELEWLDDIRVLGENPKTTASSTVWLSGPASVGVDGDVRFKLGEDPDPALLDLDGAGYMHPYYREGNYPWCAPFHTKCHEVLRRYLGVESLDREVLNHVFKSMGRRDVGTDDMWVTCLGIDYGDISPHRTTDWFAKRHFEYLVCDPINVEWLKRFNNNLPLRREGDSDQVGSYNVKGDPFIKLPSDILSLLIWSLPTMETVFKMRMASPSIANVPLTQSFWRRRIQKDMPWLWDMAAPSDEERLSVDWRQVYKELFWESQKNRTLGLCNRRRIWTQLCPLFGKQYASVAAIKEKWGSPVIPALKDSHEKLPASWGTLNYQDGVPIISTLIDTMDELNTAQHSIVVSWGHSGELIDIEILKESDPMSMSACSLRPTWKKDVVDIPDQDWLAGFIITSREIPANESQAIERCVVGIDVLFVRQAPVHLGSNDGDKRLSYPEEGNFIVALSRHSDGQLITGLANIELQTALASGCSRVNGTVRAYENLRNSNYLWLGMLPPTHLRLSQANSQFEFRECADGNPMELLLFGNSEEELRDVTSIAVEAGLKGIQVDYGHLPSRKIGLNFDTMQMFHIDARRGERVSAVNSTLGNVRVNYTLESRVTSLTVTTNKGRSFTFGNVQGKEIPLQLSDGLMPCGFYACWASFQDRERRLMCIGVVGSTLLAS